SRHIESPAGKDRSLIDRQIPGTTVAGAAKSYLGPGFNSPGLSSIRIDYREVADTRHVSTLLNRMRESCDRGLYHAARTFPFVSVRRKAAIAIVAYAMAANTPIALPNDIDAERYPTSVGKSAPVARPRL